MRLVNTRLGMEIELYENQVLNLTIETPERFAEVVYNVSKQVEGEEGDFILSDIEKELSLERKAIMVSNPLTDSYKVWIKFFLITINHQRIADHDCFSLQREFLFNI